MRHLPPWLCARGPLPPPALAAVLLMGCATARTDVSSNQDPGAPMGLESMLVVSYLPRVEEDWAEPFARAMQVKLQEAGVRAMVQTRSPVAVESDRERYAWELVDFKPETVLAVVPRSGTVDAEGRHLTRQFDAALYRDAKGGRRELVWRARLTLDPNGPRINPPDLSVLARDIIKQLKQDGIIGPPEEDIPPGERKPPQGLFLL